MRRDKRVATFLFAAILPLTAACQATEEALPPQVQPSATPIPAASPTQALAFLRIPPEQAEQQIYNALAQDLIRIPIPYDVTQGGRVEQTAFGGTVRLGAADLPVGTVFVSPLQGTVSDFSLSGFRILEIGHSGVYFRFYLRDAEMVYPPGERSLNPGEPVFRVSEATAPVTLFGGLQVVFAFVRGGEINTLSTENLLRAPDDALIYIGPRAPF